MIKIRGYHCSRFQLLFITTVIPLVLWSCAAKLEVSQLPLDQAPGDYSYLKSHITSLIKNETEKHKIVGLSIAVVDDQELVWSQGFGYAVKSERKKADNETVYRVGSITKLFTAIAIMQLAEQGQLDIDSTLVHHLPEFKIKSRFPAGSLPTIRDLLTHHGGIPSGRLQDFAFLSPPPEGYEKLYLRLPSQFADDYMARPPGTAFAYSNLGFSLLGSIITRVSGESYPEEY